MAQGGVPPSRVTWGDHSTQSDLPSQIPLLWYATNGKIGEISSEPLVQIEVGVAWQSRCRGPSQNRDWFSVWSDWRRTPEDKAPVRNLHCLSDEICNTKVAVCFVAGEGGIEESGIWLIFQLSATRRNSSLSSFFFFSCQSKSGSLCLQQLSPDPLSQWWLIQKEPDVFSLCKWMQTNLSSLCSISTSVAKQGSSFLYTIRSDPAWAHLQSDRLP
ncbi:hypothetical protein MRB53_008106 [Persea americana]|uniref:Uncharacterized protein n=1 Tax=Persea americana TaxID=3435 RepID=A0ACC2ML54_PERAE|nr:hypothetical protein MRB53_008106 [Persea americana]